MSLATLPSSRQARRRAADLHGAAANRGPAHTGVRLEAALAGLALPVRADLLAARLPAAIVATAVAAAALAGLVGLVGLGLACTGAMLALWRSAPRRRAAAVERALPLVLDGVARHLRAGGSLAQAMATVRPPATAPDLQRSWARLNDLIGLVGVAAALEDWASRPSWTTTPTRRQATRARTATDASPSIRLTVAALSLAASTGGSPARAIDGVAATLRSRLAVADEIRALSSQARASAVVIALAPVAFGILAGAGDGRTRAFLASPPGGTLIAMGLALDAVGAWWMSRLCRPSATA